MSVNKKGITVLYEAERPVIEYVRHRGGSQVPAACSTLADPFFNSIIFVHGFTGDPEKTWTLKKAKQDISSDPSIAPSLGESSRSSATTPSTTKHPRSSEFDAEEKRDLEKQPNKLRRLITGRGSREIRRHDKVLATAPGRNVFWPRDLLPTTAPDARILTYGYDTKIRHAFVGPVSENTVADHGWDLLCSLEDVRRDSTSRPLLFIAHSLGGLVAKVALIKSRDSENNKPHLHHIMASTAGVFFFGTPHRGADPLGPGLRRILTAMATGFALKLNDKIVETLMPKGEYLREIRDGFLSLAKQRRWAIYSFQEEYGVGGLAGRKVVDDESSRLDEPTIETPRHISNNHMDMVRFSGRGDNGYQKVASAIDFVISNLESTGVLHEDSGAVTFSVGQTRSSAMGVDSPLSPEKLQARMELLDLLSFDEIDARLLSLKAAHDKTCRWLLEKHEYREWLKTECISDHHGFLWIKGKPGAGKSILMKFLDSNTRRTASANCEIVVISFFFNARGEQLEQSTLGLYRSLLWQLLQKVKEVQTVLDLLDINARRFIQQRGWQIELLKEILALALEHFKGHRELRLFIDALDECSDDDVADMVVFFQGMGERAADHGINLRICFSSRYYPTIYLNKGIEIKLDEEEDHALDIGHYIKSHLQVGRSKNADELRGRILEKSAGIFLWVALVIPLLNKLCSGGKLDRFQSCLNEMPSGLHDLFEMIVKRDEEDLDEFRLCIQWVLFAVRPLRIEEYFFALRRPDKDADMSFWELGEITQVDLLHFVHSSSKGFAEVSKTRSKQKAPTVQFIHESVRDFFLSKNPDEQRKLWELADHNRLASLSHNKLRDRCCEEINITGRSAIPSLIPLTRALPKASSEDAKALRQLVSRKFPFLEYATNSMFNHAEAAAVEISQSAFLGSTPVAVWINLYNLFARYDTRRYVAHASFLHILSVYNTTRLLKTLLIKDTDIDLKGKDGWMLLFKAVANGNEDVVQLLIERGAEVDSNRAHEQHTLLSRATASGHLGIVKLLLEKGAKVTLESGNDSFKPLYLAAKIGHESLARLLLVEGAKIDPKAKSNQRLLVDAIMSQKEAVVKLLLEGGADVNFQNWDGQTPLHKATSTQDNNLVQLLIEAGANVNLRDRSGRTPLHEATSTQDNNLVQLLIEAGANVNLRDRSGRTPLHEATSTQDNNLVQILIEAGADVNFQNWDGRTPLHEATLTQDNNLVQLLIEAGANVNSRDQQGRTPKLDAVRAENEALVRLLIEREGKVDLKDLLGRLPLHEAITFHNKGELGDVLREETDTRWWHLAGQTPLHKAMILRHERLVKFLIEIGTDVNERDSTDHTPMWEASCWGQEWLVDLLLQKGATVNSEDDPNETPLWPAVRSGYEGIVKLLLERGANMNERDELRQTPLWLAVYSGYEGIVKLLLDKGADVDVKNRIGETPLWPAVRSGYEGIVKLLLERGADVNVKNMFNETLLGLANRVSREGMIELLLANGADVDCKDDESCILLLDTELSEDERSITELLI